LSDASNRMDRIYHWQIGLYDVTRRYYLLGREALIEALAPPSGTNVLEIGCGTGRNLVKAARRWPGASFYGIDVSHVMLGKAQDAIDRAGLKNRVQLSLADATAFDAQAHLAEDRFQRIYFSYTLSMIPEWRQALERAAAMLPPGGTLLVTDFGAFEGLPSYLSRPLLSWLSLFSVTPNHEFDSVFKEIAAARGFESRFVSLYRGYSFLATMRRPE
jgi:S-adenosylmethionine-diacylgycerolhomoserine-N-methlytransferase